MTALKPRTASVVIYQGDDMERLSELRRAAEIARRNFEAAKEQPRRIGDDVGEEDLREKQAAYDEFVDEAADRAVVVEVTALKRATFRSLMSDHPPREKNEDDEGYGVNLDTFPEPFLRESVTKVEVGDGVLSPGETNDLIDSLSEGDYERVFTVAYYLNRAPGADPRDGRYSSAPRSSAEI